MLYNARRDRMFTRSHYALCRILTQLIHASFNSVIRDIEETPFTEVYPTISQLRAQRLKFNLYRQRLREWRVPPEAAAQVLKQALWEQDPQFREKLLKETLEDIFEQSWNKLEQMLSNIEGHGWTSEQRAVLAQAYLDLGDMAAAKRIMGI